MTRGLAKRVLALAPSEILEIEREAKELASASGVRSLVTLAAGEPCFDTPANIKAAACEALTAGRTKYEPTAGDYALREAICAKLRNDNGFSSDVGRIMVTPGAKYAIYLAFQALIEEGDRVVLLDPSWVTYEPAARLAGADVVRLGSRAQDGFRPDMREVRKTFEHAVRLVVLNSPCNPTGTVVDAECIREIAALAQSRGSYVLSDEIYEALTYEGASYSPGSEFENVITVGGFSKTYAMTGWRLGYVEAPPEVISALVKITQHSTSCVTAFAQAGALEALSSEASRAARAEMIRWYKAARDRMLGLIAESEYLECSVWPSGAFYVFPSFRLKWNSRELARELLRQAQVAVVPGTAFGPSGEGHLRLSYAASEDAVREGFARLDAFFKAHVHSHGS